MRSAVPAYELRAPADISAALDALAAEPGVWRPFAGGTDLMVLLEQGKLPHKKFVNLWKLRELRGIEVTSDSVSLGALTTYTQIREHALLQREFPMLCQAAALTGGIATQNRGTLGGNIANASPAADSPPALLAYNAELESISARRTRRAPYAGFHSGYKQMDLWPDELIFRIHLPRAHAGWRSYYRKVGTRKAQAISKVCLAATADVTDGRIREVRIALGSVAPTVVRCSKAEAVLSGERLTGAVLERACAELRSEIAPIDDIRSTAHYRARVAQNLLREFLQALPAAGRA